MILYNYFKMLSQFFCSTIESDNYCHICILLISSSPMIYIYIIKYEGKVWEGELTVRSLSKTMIYIYIIKYEGKVWEGELTVCSLSETMSSQSAHCGKQ